MNKIHLDLRKISLTNYNGIVVIISLLFALIALCYVLVHNPYQHLHENIFVTADNVRNFYRDRPGYWKLSTQSAEEDMLISEELLNYKEYDVRIGIGSDGDMAMPADTAFDVVLSHLNKSSCISLAEAKISEQHKLGLQKITIINTNGTTEFSWGDEKYPLPVVKYSARNICAPSENTILWTFQ